MCRGAWRAVGAPDNIGFALNGSHVSHDPEQCMASQMCASRGEWDPALWRTAYAPGTVLPPRGWYCIETCGTPGFTGAPGYVMGPACALHDVNECLEGQMKCTGAMYCVNHAPVFGVLGYECVCADDAFATSDPAAPCSTSGVQLVFHVAPRNASAHSMLPMEQREQQEQALLAAVVRALQTAGAIHLTTVADMAAVLRSSTVLEGRVSMRIAEVFILWHFSGSHGASVTSVLAQSANYQLVEAVAIAVTAHGTAAEISAQSHSFHVHNTSYVGLVVVVDLVFSPAMLSGGRTPVLYLAHFDDTVSDADNLESQVCRTDVAVPENVRCCLEAIAAAYTVTRSTAREGTCPATGGAAGLPPLVEGAFWADSNTSRAERTGPLSVRLWLAAGDLEVHNFTALVGSGSVQYLFVVGVLFVKTDAATGATQHVQQTRHAVRATLALVHQALFAQFTGDIMRTPIDIALYRVYNQTQHTYSESVDVVLYVGTATANALVRSPVMFASSLQFGIGSDPDIVAEHGLVHSCSASAAESVLVHSHDTCTAKKVCAPPPNTA